MNHPNIIKYRGHGENEHFYFILTDKCNQGNLRNVLRLKKRFSELETRYIIFQLSNALKYLHQMNLIHRDIKLDNIFLHENKVQLGDFGFSTILRNNGEKAKSICGTPNYIAPEILEKKPYDMMVDIWSLGVLTYTLLVGIPPFESKDTQQAYEKIKRCEYSIPKDLAISEESKSFIERCLTLDPSKRISSNELCLHPFFTKTPSIPESISFTEIQSPLKQIVPITESHSDEKFINKKRTCASVSNLKTVNAHKKKKVQENNFDISPDVLINDVICMNINQEKQLCTMSLMKSEILRIYKRINELCSSTDCNKEPSYYYNDHRYGHHWISKWIDATRDNIGFGYQLCDGSIGIHFNDKVRMYGSSKKDKIDISYFKQSNKDRNYVTESVDMKSLLESPKIQMKRRILIYQKLLSHLPPKLTSIGLGMVCESKKEESDCTSPLLFWHLMEDRTIVFMFENFTIQINFSDHTKLIMTFPPNTDRFLDINKKPEMITYVNKNGQYETLCSVRISSKELWKESKDKFKRASKILHYLFNMKDDELCPLFNNDM